MVLCLQGLVPGEGKRWRILAELRVKRVNGSDGLGEFLHGLLGLGVCGLGGEGSQDEPGLGEDVLLIAAEGGLGDRRADLLADALALRGGHHLPRKDFPALTPPRDFVHHESDFGGGGFGHGLKGVRQKEVKGVNSSLRRSWA